MRAYDTSQEAHELQLRGYRRMTVAQKAELVADLSEAVRELARLGIRRRHPGYADDEVKRALALILYGRETQRTLWPGEEPREP